LIEIKPTSQSQREPIIDILRGWALFSVAVMNYSTIYSWNNHSNENETDSLTETFKIIFETLFESKGWTLLAILFGYGFSILLKKISNDGQSHYLFFAKRMLWLFVFGFVNSLFFGGDILNDYALMGIILLGFYNLSTKSLAIVGATILILTPALQSILGNYHLLFTPKYRDTFYELYNHNSTFESIKANLFMRYKWMLRLSYSIILHLIQLGCFLLGVALQRSNFFEKLGNEPKSFIRKIVIYSFLISVIIYLLQNEVEKNEWKLNEYYNLYYPQVISVMIFTTSLVCWTYYSGYGKSAFKLLKITGKMTLTNYILQNIIAFILFINLRPNWNWQSYILVGIVIYIFQLFFSKWWLTKYNYGFFEWLWRCLSYQQWISLKKIKSDRTTLSKTHG